MKNKNTFRGCMFGGAAGDALGYTVEFMRSDEIFERFGENGITEYVPDPADHTAHFSDDTQMTLFTAGGLLTGRAMGVALGYPEHIWRAYRDWYEAQFGIGVEADETVFGSTWLFRVPALNNQRAPGRTCMNALEGGKKGSIESPVNNSKGCGGVMRVAPVGLYFEPGKELTAEEIDRLGAEAAALTHGHELGWLPAALLTRIINTITYGDLSEFSVPSRGSAPAENGLEKILNYSLEEFEKEFSSYENCSVLISLIRKAMELAKSDTPDAQAVSELGEGWVAEETLAIAVFCALRYSDDFEKALIASVNHDGDSDSTGAVCGNILGAYLGETAIPEKYLNGLEIPNIISEIANDLYEGYKGIDDYLWTAKYITNNFKI